MELKEIPRILISIAGEMRDLTLKKEFVDQLGNELRKVFSFLLFKVIVFIYKYFGSWFLYEHCILFQKVCDKIGRMEKQTWFFTSGIDQGVTKMIASAVEGYRWEISDIKKCPVFHKYLL